MHHSRAPQLCTGAVHHSSAPQLCSGAMKGATVHGGGGGTVSVALCLPGLHGSGVLRHEVVDIERVALASTHDVVHLAKARHRVVGAVIVLQKQRESVCTTAPCVWRCPLSNGGGGGSKFSIVQRTLYAAAVKASLRNRLVAHR
jgi:hypothetical protein